MQYHKRGVQPEDACIRCLISPQFIRPVRKKLSPSSQSLLATAIDLDFQSLPKILSKLSLRLCHSSGLLLCPPIFVSSPNNRPAKALPLDRSPTDPNQCPSSEFHKFCSSISISKESLIIPLKPLSRISRLEDISVKLSLRFQHPGYELFKRQNPDLSTRFRSTILHPPAIVQI